MIPYNISPWNMTTSLASLMQVVANIGNIPNQGMVPQFFPTSNPNLFPIRNPTRRANVRRVIYYEVVDGQNVIMRVENYSFSSSDVLTCERIGQASDNSDTLDSDWNIPSVFV